MLSRSYALLFKSARSVTFGPAVIVRANSTAATPGQNESPNAPKKRSAPRAASLGDVSLDRPKLKGFAGKLASRRQDPYEPSLMDIAAHNNSDISTGRFPPRSHQGQGGQRRKGQGQGHGQGQDRRVQSRDGQRRQGGFQREGGDGQQPRGQQGQKFNARRERQESGIPPRKERRVADPIEGQEEKVEKRPVKFESVQTTDLDALFGTTNNTTIQAVTAADSGSDVSKTLIRRHGQRVLEKVGGVYKQYLPVKPRSYKGDTISTIGAAGLARVYLGRHPELTQQRREKGLALVDRLVGAQQGVQA